MDIIEMWQFWMLWAGVAGTALCGIWLHRTRRFVQTASLAEGEVTELVRAVDTDNEVFYKPRFAFTTPDGEHVSVVSSVGRYPAAFKMGERIQVLYNPQKPSRAQIRSFGQLWLSPLVLLFVSLVLIAVSACSLANH